MNDERILVVCAANVCRSPLAELALRRGLRSSPVLVSSAGVRANPGAPICGEVASRHNDDEWAGQSQSHRARSVTPQLLERATIVLAASRDIRTEIVLLEPRSRDSVFTLKEAAHLGAGFSSTAQDRVAEYVAHLDHARSRTAPLTPRSSISSSLRRFVGSRGAADPTSIADRHGSRGHAATMAEVDDAVTAIVAQLNGHRRHGS